MQAARLLYLGWLDLTDSSFNDIGLIPFGTACNAIYTTSTYEVCAVACHTDFPSFRRNEVFF